MIPYCFESDNTLQQGVVAYFIYRYPIIIWIEKLLLALFFHFSNFRDGKMKKYQNIMIFIILTILGIIIWRTAQPNIMVYGIVYTF